MSTFVWPMLLREARASAKRLLLFVLCIAAGVGGLVAVKAFSHNLQRAVRGEARSLLAADIVVRSSRAPGAAEQAALAQVQAQGAQVARSLEFISMARAPATRQVQLVSVRGVGTGYPFYGEVVTGSGKPFRSLLNDDSVLVYSALLLKMGLHVGDTLEVGHKRFRIADVLVKEPDSPVQMFNLGPRVLMTEAAARETGLVTPTSRLRYAALIKVPPGADAGAMARGLQERLASSFASVDTFDTSQPRSSRFLGRLTDFLDLVGLAALLLGGIGVAGAIRVFVAQKLDTLAVLKCLGATSRDLLAVYLLLAVLMGLLGAALGVALGYGAQLALPWLLRDLMPVNVQMAWPWAAAGQGLLLGLVTTLWFALPPIWALRQVPPARVFRRQVEAEAPRKGRRRWLAPLRAGLSLLLLAALLAVWQAGFTKIAGFFVLGLAGAVAALHLSALGLLALLRRLPKPAGFELRQGLSSLYRPGNQSGAVVMSLGLGVLLLLAVFLIQQDLLRQLVASSPESQPNLFFLDIQPDERAQFDQVLASHGYDRPELIPVIRARIAALNGKPLRLDEVHDAHQRRHLRFEYSLTYRDRLVDGEQVIAGHFAKDPAIPGPQVSLADWFAEDSDLHVGNTVTVDIQGVQVRATVTSIRKVDWANRRANFSFVFLPGALEDAPRMYVSALRVPDETRRVTLQRDLVNALPNVTVLDVEMIYRIIQTLLDRIGVVIQFMAAFCIAVGLVILLAAIATTKYQRIREAVLLKTLGATRGAVARVLAVEYLVLGGLAGAVGAVAAGAFSWGLVTYVFEGRWDLSLPPYLAAWAVTALLIAGTGLVSSLDVLMKKPLEVLREE
ncbi:MAG TPA: FtsX-like permease family protein [bacterium]|nr:FtsX-like permease family protein [bacterium]